MAVAVEAVAVLLQATFPLILDTSLFHIAIVVYIAAIALDEIDFRDLLGRVAESRFQRIAMSLGDGLICTDSELPDHGVESGRDRDLRLSARGDDRPAVRHDLRRATKPTRSVVFDPRTPPGLGPAAR